MVPKRPISSKPAGRSIRSWSGGLPAPLFVKHRTLVPDQRQDMQDRVLPQLLTPNRKMWTKP